MKNRKSFDVILNNEHNDKSQAKKVVNGGLIAKSFVATPATAQIVGVDQLLRAINTDVVIQYIGIGGALMAVPAIGTGFGIPAGQSITISSSDQEYVRTSSNLVQVVILEDE